MGDNANTIHVGIRDVRLTHFNRPITLIFQHSAHRNAIVVSHYSLLYFFLFYLTLFAFTCFFSREC